jgi:divalent metal cation (Fe/Co/Zn/Cd) transporter
MPESKIAVCETIAASIWIALTTFIVDAVSCSSAMQAEPVQSGVDTINDALILIGIRLRKRPATPHDATRRDKVAPAQQCGETAHLWSAFK